MSTHPLDTPQIVNNLFFPRKTSKGDFTEVDDIYDGVCQNGR